MNVLLGIAAVIGIVWSLASLAVLGWTIAVEQARRRRHKRTLTREQVMQ